MAERPWKWIFVSSSNIDALGYDIETQKLFVMFKGDVSGAGAIWAYSGVSCEVFARLITAQSVGSFFQKSVKPGHAAERLTDAQ